MTKASDKPASQTTAKAKSVKPQVKDKEDSSIIREDWPQFEYEPQPAEELDQLDTSTDQVGHTVVEHVYKRCREVFGQPPLDIKKVNWKEFGVPEFQGRPSPFDFPAFEHERDLTVVTVTTNGDKKTTRTSQEPAPPSRRSDAKEAKRLSRKLDTIAK